MLKHDWIFECAMNLIEQSKMLFGNPSIPIGIMKKCSKISLNTKQTGMCLPLLPIFIYVLLEGLLLNVWFATRACSFAANVTSPLVSSASCGLPHTHLVHTGLQLLVSPLCPVISGWIQPSINLYVRLLVYFSCSLFLKLLDNFLFCCTYWWPIIIFLVQSINLFLIHITTGF